MKIQNAQKTFFNSKEEYLAFRRNWAAVCNSEDRKKFVDGPYGRYKVSKLTALHHFVYLFLCGKDVNAGFTPITSTVKLANGMFAHQALSKAKCDFNTLVQQIVSLKKEPQPQKKGLLAKITGSKEDYRATWLEYQKKNVENFFEPFGDTLSKETVLKLESAIQEAWNESNRKKREAA